nr:hypothetical protein [Rhodococcus sp. (in: high G+C Gram-positive bacteria)]
MNPTPELSAATYWSNLAAAADQGHLFLASEVARSCSLHCDGYLDKLRQRLEAVQAMPRAAGYGNFDSGTQLADFYSDRMSGGENSMAAVLQSHIDVVMEMQAVFNKFFTVTTDNDEANGADIVANGPN